VQWDQSSNLIYTFLIVFSRCNFYLWWHICSAFYNCAILQFCRNSSSLLHFFIPTLDLTGRLELHFNCIFCICIFVSVCLFVSVFVFLCLYFLVPTLTDRLAAWKRGLTQFNSIEWSSNTRKAWPLVND